MHVLPIIVAQLSALTFGTPCNGDLDGFGAWIENINDLDSDGVEDLAIGDPNPDPECADPGYVWIVSGKKHSLIARLEGDKSDKWFGQSVAYLPDSSLDAKGLFIVGSTTNFAEFSLSLLENQKDSGRIYVTKSGGSRHKLLTGDASSRRFGLRVRCAGDVDGDKASDFIVCAPARERDGGPGAVYIYSGNTLTKLAEVTGYGGDSRFGENAIVTRPVVADGSRILACSAGPDIAARTRSVVLYRIARSADRLDLKKLSSIRGRSKEMTFGHALCDLGDIDGDGSPDIAISAPELSSMRMGDDPPDAVYPRGRVLIVSTKDGSVLREITMVDKTGFFGADVCASAGSAWGGKPVLLVTSSQNPGSTAGLPLLCAYSLATGELVERLDVKGRTGAGVLVLRGSANEERIVSSRCDRDAEGLPGVVVMSSANTRSFDTVLRRTELKAKLK